MNVKYQAYEAYKDSGVEWLGKIPKHWISTELKRYSMVQGGYAFSSDHFIDSGKAVIRIGDIKQDGSVSLYSCKYVKSEGVDQYNQYEVKSGDLLMAMTGATIGKAGWFKGNESALLNQRVGSFKCKRNYLNYTFFWYVLNSSGYQEYIKLTAFGGAQPNISDTGMVGYRSTFPSEDEQEKIANFLDHETAKIDTLIEKQQQLIKLLKEKRQAVISNAVTKGLNPNAPMRDSGVEWLGEVPEHWRYIKLKHITNEIIDTEHKTAEYFDDGKFLVCRTTNVRNGMLHLEGGKYTNLDTYNEWTKRGAPEVGDILFTREAPAGEACIVTGEVTLCLGQRMVLFKLKKDRIEPEYALHSIYSGLADDFVKQLSQGSTVAHFNMADIQNIPLFEPPLEEQNEIIVYLTKTLSKYDGLIWSASEGINLIQERRTALISAAVTGKIDVRDWQAPNSDNKDAIT